MKVLVAIALSAILIACTESQQPASGTDPLADLVRATPSALRPDGDLAEIFVFGSKSTDLQRENALASIKGQVVQWELPVYDIARDGSEYKIQTQGGGIKMFDMPTRRVGAFIYLMPRSDEDRRHIESLKTDDVISFKGVIRDSFMRNLEIRPAILAPRMVASVVKPRLNAEVGMPSEARDEPRVIEPKMEVERRALPLPPEAPVPAPASSGEQETRGCNVVKEAVLTAEQEAQYLASLKNRNVVFLRALLDRYVSQVPSGAHDELNFKALSAYPIGGYLGSIILFQYTELPLRESVRLDIVFKDSPTGIYEAHITDANKLFVWEFKPFTECQRKQVPAAMSQVFKDPKFSL